MKVQQYLSLAMRFHACIALLLFVSACQVEEGLRERELAAVCGYDFVIGVRTETHEKMLEEAEPRLNVVLMKWCK